MPPPARSSRIYNYINDLPALEGTVTPFLPGNSVRKTIGNVTTLRRRPRLPVPMLVLHHHQCAGPQVAPPQPDDVERILRENFEHGINRFFITDDNFARNKDWEPIFDRIIKLREEDGMDVRFLIQVDTLCHKIPNFVAKAKRAGVTRIFIGLENINPDNLLAAKKRQNKITEYRNMLLAWKAVGIWTYAGYILGFPERHAGIVAARHRDHQEGNAARRAGVLLPHAAARLRGSQGAVDQGRADRSRSQQIRSRARAHPARAT